MYAGTAFGIAPKEFPSKYIRFSGKLNFSACVAKGSVASNDSTFSCDIVVSSEILIFLFVLLIFFSFLLKLY